MLHFSISSISDVLKDLAALHASKTTDYHQASPHVDDWLLALLISACVLAINLITYLADQFNP